MVKEAFDWMLRQSVCVGVKGCDQTVAPLCDQLEAQLGCETQTHLSCPSCEGWVQLCPGSVSPQATFPGVRSVELPPAPGFCPPTPPPNPEEEVVFI